MPSHLHPRSTATSALFAGTLLASFAVVAVPHIWPCPRPRIAYMDSEIIIDEHGRAMRRVRKGKKTDNVTEQEAADLVKNNTSRSHARPHAKGNTMEDEAAILRQLQAEAAILQQDNARRECPIPKPKGVLGRVLGFESDCDNGDAS